MRVYRYNEIGLLQLIFGKGLVIMAGTVGVSNYPMCHNQFFQLIFTGGIFYFISFMILLSKKYFGKERSFEKAVIIVHLCNMLIGAAEFFHPVYAVLIFVFLFVDRSNSVGFNIKDSERINNILCQ